MEKNLLPAAVLLCVSLTCATIPATAETAEPTVENALERINLSGKLRMLSQRIPSAACHLNRGIDVDNASTILAASTLEFEQILNALELGDAALNIVNPEERRKTLVRIAELREIWVPFQTASQAVADGTASNADLSYVMAENGVVLTATQLLVEELIEQYSNPNAATRASLMLIDIAGRQRMLTQKISKETCVIGSDNATDQAADDLMGSVAIFDASLEALRFGMPQVGINPPPNPQISAELDAVLTDWMKVKPLLSEVASGASLDNDTHMFKFQALNNSMSGMNTVVDLYAEASGTY